jgi:sec-independent protein translocase protein TatA
VPVRDEVALPFQRFLLTSTTIKETFEMFYKEPSVIIVILLAFIVLFGAKRLPDSAKSIAKALKIFKSEMKEIKGEEKKKEEEDGTEK